MPARLIVNADDFGLTRGINRAIAELHRAGVLTSATLMATGAAFDDAVAVARGLPSLGVGCHVVLVDGAPVLAPGEIGTLLGPDGRGFRRTLGAFLRDLALGRIDGDEIAREARAQVERLRNAGIAVTHVDTHKHTHLFPAVARPLAGVVRTMGVAAMRRPFEPRFAREVSRPGAVRRWQLTALERLRPAFERAASGSAMPEGTLGMAATGTLSAGTLRALLASLPAEGTYELCCHPGYNDAELNGVATRLRAEREMEREALLGEVAEIFSLPQPTRLIHYGSLKSEGEAHR